MNKYSLITAAALLCSALPAAADQRPEHIVPSHRALQVDEYLPQSGAVGSLITVRGKGLRQAKYALVGGHKAWFEHASSDEVTFRVPQQHGDGVIELYVPDRGNVAVGRFTVFSMLGIEGFSPRSGKPGDQVEIRGQGFQHGDQVLLGDRQLTVLHLDASRIVVRVPDGASTGHFTVMRHGGLSERSAYPFQVERHAGFTLEDVQPRQGLPGTRVVLYGRSLKKVDRVLLHGVSLPIVQRRGNELEVEIPYGAHSGAIALQVRGHVQPTPFRFDVLRGAIIEGFAPAVARPGHTLSIRGRGFGADARVMIGGHEAALVARTAGELQVSVPRGLRAGLHQVRVISGGRAAVAAQALDVRHGIAIRWVSPGRVRAGARVTIHGLGFDERTRVFWGQHELRVLGRSRNGKRIEVLAPGHARGTQYLSVDDGAGRVQTGTSLAILPQRWYTYRGELHATLGTN